MTIKQSWACIIYLYVLSTTISHMSLQDKCITNWNKNVSSKMSGDAKKALCYISKSVPDNCDKKFKRPNQYRKKNKKDIWKWKLLKKTIEANKFDWIESEPSVKEKLNA